MNLSDMAEHFGQSSLFFASHVRAAKIIKQTTMLARELHFTGYSLLSPRRAKPDF
jgi:hypothetical protein